MGGGRGRERVICSSAGKTDRQSYEYSHAKRNLNDFLIR